MATKAQNKTVLIAVAGALVVSAAGFYLGISPQLADRSAAVSKTTVAEQASASLKLKVVDLKGKQSKIDTVISDVTDLTVSFPPELKQGESVDMIVAAGARAGVKVTSIVSDNPIDPASVDALGNPIVAPVAPVPVDKVKGNVNDAPAPVVQPAQTNFPMAQVTVSIIAEGSSNTFDRFLYQLSQMERPVLVDQISIIGDKGDRKITVTGKTFLTRPLDISAAEAK